MVSRSEDLLPISQEFLRLASSTPFCLLLAHMTELDLMENVIKQEPTVNERNENGGCGTMEQDILTGPASRLSASSEGISEAEPNEVSKVELTSTSLCRADVYSWKHGSYVLAGDSTDPGLGRFCLELVLNFNSEGE